MARKRIDLDAIVACALGLADKDGLEEVALGRVAESLGVQASALYNHLDGADGLRHEVAVRSTENLASTLRDAAVARSGVDAVRSVAHAYRDFASEHPGQYASTLLPPSNSEDDLVTFHKAIIDLFRQILGAFDLDDGALLHRARALRSAIHGFVALEAIDAFTYDEPTVTSFDSLLDLVLCGIQTETH
jgi:AcrR family transcriptional regulator